MDGWGQRLRKLRHRAGLTQLQLAVRLGVRLATLSDWERNDGSPSMANVCAAADFFGVSIEWLVRGRGRQKAAA
jgi:transcriptional regulator with XRE-family HTH domain